MYEVVQEYAKNNIQFIVLYRIVSNLIPWIKRTNPEYFSFLEIKNIIVNAIRLRHMQVKDVIVILQKGIYPQMTRT